MTVGFIGNPNCGKTTLFNAYTGANLKVANWPGVTVERKEGRLEYNGREYKLVDLPGIYSLGAHTPEERVSRDYILSGGVDMLVNVADASTLERSLYLTLQLLELGKPVVLALNMMDIVRKRGLKINMRLLSELLGVPVVPVSAREKAGLDDLIGAVADYRGGRDHRPLHANGVAGPQQRYKIIENIAVRVVAGGGALDFTGRADRLLTHKVLGLPIFLLIMAGVFFCTFAVGDWLKDYFGVLLYFAGRLVSAGLIAVRAHGLVYSLVIDGVMAGVGGMLSFLPNIFILFLALALLEDSGYMARVAYIMDGIMGRFGLSGKACLPLLLGFGCTVPAVMASRTLESRRDRLRVMLLAPFMSCSAKLPVYVLFTGLFFPGRAVIILYSMYITGVLVAALSAAAVNKISGGKQEHMLLIELPEYKMPGAQVIFIYIWDKVKDYLSRAGTVILAASVILWLVLNFGPSGHTGDISGSFGALLGYYITPVLEPAGLGWWQVGAALLAGLAAKEIVAASFMVLFAADSAGGLAAALSDIGFGALNAYALMVFCVLYPPCVAALAVIKRESGSWRWLAFVAGFQVGVAWLAAVLIYRVGLLIL